MLYLPKYINAYNAFVHLGINRKGEVGRGCGVYNVDNNLPPMHPATKSSAIISSGYSAQ